MRKHSKIIVAEDFDFLNELLKSQQSHQLKQRVKSLILTKENKFKSRQELADYLLVHKATLDRWFKKYREKGLESMLTLETSGHRPSVITPELKKALSEKLHDSHNPLLSYTDAVQWIKDNYQVEINYFTLWSYLKRNFKTKLKKPRKSHYKKNIDEYEAFKKKFLKSSENLE